jgi:hypothetical protein
LGNPCHESAKQATGAYFKGVEMKALRIILVTSLRGVEN